MSKLFIVNPIAARTDTDVLTEKIKTVFGNGTRIVRTEYGGHAAALAEESEEDEVFAVGGDGTVCEVADGIVRRIERSRKEDKSCSPPVFSAIPAGSGNDFARSEYGADLKPEKVIGNFAEGKYSPGIFDVGRVNDRHFVNIASVGFDAEIVHNAERYKNSALLRKFSYILSIFYTVFRFKGVDIEMDIDGEVTSRKMLLLAVANGRYYGGGIKIAPDADMKDGLFDIIYIPMLRPLHTLYLLPHLLDGSHVKCREVFVKRGKHVKVRSLSGDILLNVDGELSDASEAEFTVLPAEMKLYCPGSEGTDG